MPSNYILSSFRFIKRNKLFTAINIIGLSVALSVSFIILLYVINQYSYNTSFSNRDQIYRVLHYDVNFKNINAQSPYVLATHLKDGFSQINYVARTRKVRDFKFKIKDEYIKVNRVLGADSDILKIFDLNVIGQLDNVLNDVNAIVLSRSQADLLFSGEDPIGKDVLSNIDGHEVVLEVKAVFEDLPVNSTFRADCFIHTKYLLSYINNAFGTSDADTNWDYAYWETWIMLNKGFNAARLDVSFRDLENVVFNSEERYVFSLQQLSDIYLNSPDVNGNGIAGSLLHIRIFSAIAILILMVAAFNYVILSTAVSSQRAKEIGVRKANGASTSRIRLELLFESIILTILVLPFALLFTAIGKPYAEQLFHSDLPVIQTNMLIYILVCIALILLIGITSGLYTSSYLAKLDVVKVLKRNMHSEPKKVGFRNVLIVLQLTIFSALISCAFIIRSQYDFAIEKDLGFKQENILLVTMGQYFDNYSVFMNEVKTISEVTSSGGAMYSIPTWYSGSSMVDHFTDNTKKVQLEGLVVDFEFIETMGLTMVEGRSFSKEFSGDIRASILNETAVNELGIVDPIGKQIDGSIIIGVVKDFHLHSIHTKIPALSLYMAEGYNFEAALQYKPGSLSSLLPKVKAKWEELAPDRPFKYALIEDHIQNVYEKEKNLSRVISIAAFFALFIAALGLFALTLFVAEKQTKEIGIRKLHGGTPLSIIKPMLRKYMFKLLVANLLAVPLTLYFMQQWLSHFSYATHVNWGVFIIAFLLASILVLTTTIYYLFHVVRRNPVEALRYE